MRQLLIVLAAAVWVSAGCAPKTPAPSSVRPPPYTADEKSRMTFCVGVADVAMAIADDKRMGRPITEVKALYAGKPNAELTVPLVDKVYGEAITNPWDYAVSFFKECALAMANVSSNRVDFASSCMQNGMIASVAQAYRDSGAPKEQAYERFARFDGPTPRAIIDDVYARPSTRSQVVLDAWNRCMMPISRGETRR
jgi:hypothetical protein